MFFFLVFRVESHIISNISKNGVHDFYDSCSNSAVKHVDCNDGQYVRSCYWTKWKGVDETGMCVCCPEVSLAVVWCIRLAFRSEIHHLLKSFHCFGETENYCFLVYSSMTIWATLYDTESTGNPYKQKHAGIFALFVSISINILCSSRECALHLWHVGPH